VRSTTITDDLASGMLAHGGVAANTGSPPPRCGQGVPASWMSPHRRWRSPRPPSGYGPPARRSRRSRSRAAACDLEAHCSTTRYTRPAALPAADLIDTTALPRASHSRHRKRACRSSTRMDAEQVGGLGAFEILAKDSSPRRVRCS